MALPSLLPLDKLDPAREWQAWQPDATRRWDRQWAGHLYRRAAFGAHLDELRAAEKRGPQATLDLLLQGQPECDDLLPALLTAGQLTATADEPDSLRGWWVYCMLHSGHPLREKLTLFWHNHFATSIAKVKSTREMFNQNKLLRQLALGKFGPFLLAISRDAAMIHWLDSNGNIKGKPNENYAREIMELFSLGLGHYTEKDIREAARAFTGWHTDSDGFGFEFAPRLHDDGVKTFLGQTGNWNGDDVVRIILQQPAAATFLVRKLYHFYVSETQEPTDGFLEPLADAFRKSDYDITALVRRILSSRHFFSDYAFRQRIKSPVEFVLGAVRSVYREYDAGDKRHQPLTQQNLVRYIDAMGQLLFAPPNVKGWRGAKAWLNTATMLERDNFAQALAMGKLWGNNYFRGNMSRVEPTFPPASTGAPAGQPKLGDQPEEPPPPTAFDPARVIHEEKAGSAKDIVRVLLDVYLPGGVRPAAEEKLVAFVAAGNPKGAALDRRIRETVHALLTMPEHQLA
ncbi:MAG TPA: DUF1800 domain-containing protein [Gemmataceae bacterium]|nr:DUF1800 domain-containing protein [Gemmataceae bacterium]